MQTKLANIDNLQIGDALKIPKYLRHKPSNSALRDIISNLGIASPNLSIINFALNHTVKPRGSLSNSINNREENVFEIRTPVAANGVNERLANSTQINNEQIEHETNESGSRRETTVNITDGEAVIYTFQDMDYHYRDEEPSKGYTVFYDHLGNKLCSFVTGSRVASTSKKHADEAFKKYFTYISGGNRSDRLGKAYGTTKIRNTDSRLRWLHGGGSSCVNPYAERQGWRVTLGCTKAQNIDLENLATKIKQFQNKYPDVKIKFIRDKDGTYPQ